MAGSGRDAGGSREATTAASGGDPVPGPRTATPGSRTAVRMIALAGVVHMLRSRRFYERAITVGIGLAAAARISKENQASALARLQAWDKRQVERVQRKAKAQSHAVKGARQMMRSDVSGRLSSERHRT